MSLGRIGGFEGREMISWELTTDFSKQKHLFNGIKTKYFISTFICSCGHESFVVYKKQQWHEEYVCPVCGNDTFYNANSAKKNFIYFLSANPQLRFEYKNILNISDKNIRASLVTYIPGSIDFLRQKVYFIPIEKEFLEIDYKGNIEDEHEEQEEVDLLKDHTHKALEEMILSYIGKNLKKLDLSFLKERKFTLQQVSMFLNYKNLKEFDFYYWTDLYLLPEDKNFTVRSALEFMFKREEKSVKKAVYLNYITQLKEHESYSISLPLSFTQKIKDTNIAVKLLKLSLYEIPIADYAIDMLIDFLQVGYSEIQIYRLFSKLKSIKDAYLLNDIMRDIGSVKNINRFYKVHQKPKCNLLAIHDAVIGYTHYIRKKEMADQVMVISKESAKSCISIGGYEVRLPQTGMELYSWSVELKNCMASYIYMIANGETLVYGFFKDGVIDFGVELQDGVIIQASGKRNRVLDTRQRRVLTRWFDMFFGKEKIEKVEDGVK